MSLVLIFPVCMSIVDIVYLFLYCTSLVNALHSFTALILWSAMMY